MLFWFLYGGHVEQITTRHYGWLTFRYWGVLANNPQTLETLTKLLSCCDGQHFTFAFLGCGLFAETCHFCCFSRFAARNVHETLPCAVSHLTSVIQIFWGHLRKGGEGLALLSPGLTWSWHLRPILPLFRFSLIHLDRTLLREVGIYLFV